jgi:hypothetical protein
VSNRQVFFGIAALALHLSLVLATCLQDLSATLGGGQGVLSPSGKRFLGFAGRASSYYLAQSLPTANPVRQTITTYTEITGIEAGYSFFAPVVSGPSRLVFELHYSNGRIEYDVPAVGSAATGYRISTLLDHLAAVHYVRLREALLQSLVEASHREHPEAVLIRAVFGVADLVSAKEYRAGRRTSYRPLYVYDFRFDGVTPGVTDPLDR